MKMTLDGRRSVSVFRGLSIAAMAGVFLCATLSEASVQLKKHDRLVFLGDSITAGGVRPGGYISLASKVIRKGVAGLRRRMAPRAHPEQLFDRVDTAPTERPDTSFLMIRHDRPEIRIEPVSTRRLATCAWASTQRDLGRLTEHYLAFRFAYPELRNEFLENARQRHGEILSSALLGRPAYAVYHPPRVDLSTLHREMEPFS